MNTAPCGDTCGGLGALRGRDRVVCHPRDYPRITLFRYKSLYFLRFLEFCCSFAFARVLRCCCCCFFFFFHQISELLTASKLLIHLSIYLYIYLSQLIYCLLMCRNSEWRLCPLGDLLYNTNITKAHKNKRPSLLHKNANCSYCTICTYSI